MSTEQYVSYNNSTFQLHALATALQELLTTGVVDITVTGQLKLKGAVHDTAGRIRLNDTGNTPYIEYSNDSGQTWKPLVSDTYQWLSTHTYAVGDVVLYNAGWYKCVTASPSGTPNTSAGWALLTPGTCIRYVQSVAQLNAALSTDVSSITIHIIGDIDGNITATILADTVTVISSESVVVSADSIALTGNGSTKIYWHCSGTYIEPSSAASISISLTSCTLYVDYLRGAQTAASVTGTLYYQAIEGTFTGTGVSYLLWTTPGITNGMVPRDLSSLSPVQFADTLKLYVSGSTNGYLTAQTLLNQVMSKASKYLKVDAQGTLASRPATAAEGYLYFATDTGDLYRRGALSWDTGVHIQGPQGSAGAAGAAGANGVSPTVSISQTASGYSITITDVTHPSGQTFSLTNGQNGTTPTFAIGTVTTVQAGQPATVTMSTVGTVNTLSFEIPKGADGLNALTFTYPMQVLSNVVSITGIPSAAIEQALNTITAVPGHVYDVSASAITALTVTPSGTASTFGICYILCLFGASASITAGTGLTVVDQPEASKYNLLKVLFIGQSARLYVEDTWAP